MDLVSCIRAVLPMRIGNKGCIRGGGIRRCGKSTLFRLFRDELLTEGIAPEQIISINFEELEYEHLCDYRVLYNYILDRIQPDQMNYIFLDEIQHVDQFHRVVDSLFVKITRTFILRAPMHTLCHRISPHY